MRVIFSLSKISFQEKIFTARFDQFELLAHQHASLGVVVEKITSVIFFKTHCPRHEQVKNLGKFRRRGQMRERPLQKNKTGLPRRRYVLR